MIMFLYSDENSFKLHYTLGYSHNGTHEASGQTAGVYHVMRGWETEPRRVGQLATEQESLGCGFLPSSCALFLFSFFPLLWRVTTGLTSSFYSVILRYLSLRLSGK